ncbi:MAG: signal peptidase II, partial [Nitrospirota bacterium]
MNIKYIIILIITLPVIVLDQLTKFYIQKSMKLHQSIKVIDGLFDITYVLNKGAAFSFLADKPAVFTAPFFIIVSVIAIGIIGFLFYKTEKNDYVSLIAFALLLGGSIGNLIDRIRHGAVTDFLDFYFHQYHWPAFNVADSAITTGVFLFLFSQI